MRRFDPRRRKAGFTLVEAVAVIAITGILAAIVAVFIRRPVEGYFDAARRAELSDIAHTAMRRMERELHLALPNSVRVTLVGTTYFLEFIPANNGGRYRAQVDSAGAGDPLDFAAADTSFDLLGPGMSFAAGDEIVISNTNNIGALGDAYLGNSTSAHNRRPYNGAVGATVNSVAITSANRLDVTLDSPGRHFFVVNGPVTYVCTQAAAGGTGAGTLTRYWGYAMQAAQPADVTAAPLSGAASAPLANFVSACEITPPENLPQPGYALVTIRVTLLNQNERVSLYHEIHVNNVP